MQAADEVEAFEASEFSVSNDTGNEKYAIGTTSFNSRFFPERLYMDKREKHLL